METDPETRTDPAAIADERRRARELRVTVDLTASLLRQARLSRTEAERLAEATRRRALDLFPGKADTYDLIVAPRFRRILDERFGPA